MTIKDFINFIEYIKIDSEYNIEINNEKSSIYDLKQLQENTIIQYIQIKIINKQLTKEDISVYTIYESISDIEVPLHSNYNLIVFNFII